MSHEHFQIVYTYNKNKKNKQNMVKNTMDSTFFIRLE